MSVEGFRDVRVVAALIAAAASITVATLTFAYKIVGDLRDRTRSQRARLMAIRSEVHVNHELANVVLKNSRVFGIRFQDTVWKSGDTSVVHLRKVPSPLFLQLYANVEVFNVLNDRADKMRDNPKYSENPDRIAQEHAEMVGLAGQIRRDAEALVGPIGRRTPAAQLAAQPDVE